MSETERRKTDSVPGRKKHLLLRVILPILIPAALAVLLGFCSTYYYDLNDDSLMKEILSGEYTGTPEARNIQSYYPLSALLAGLYHLFPEAPVYGALLMALQLGCLGAVLARLGRIFEEGCVPVKSGTFSETAYSGGKTGMIPGENALSSGGKENHSLWLRYGAACALACGLFCALMLYHLVFLQYSVTVGILAATSAFLFLTMKEPERNARGNAGDFAAAEPGRTEEPAGKGRERNAGLRQVSGWIRMLLPGIIPIWIGFLLRSEMMLFLAPLVGFAFLLRLLKTGRTGKDAGQRISGGIRPGRQRTKVTLCTAKGRLVVLLLAAALVLGGMGAEYAANRAAYSSPEWRTFYGLFDARTRLYDFEKLPTWEEDEAFYRSIGLDESEAELIRNYNFGIDDRIDADVLNRIADYAAEKASSELSTGQRLRNALWDYRHAFTAEANRPYMLVLTVLYMLALVRVFADAVLSGNAGEKKEKQKVCCRVIVCGVSGILALFLIRSGLLLYLYYNQRPVDRLTHSLYLVEAVILAWMIFRREASPGAVPANSAGAGPVEAVEKKRYSIRRQDRAHCLYGIILLFAAVIPSLFLQVGKISEEQNAREEKNARYELLKEYASSHPDRVIFVDVYSTVDFSDRVFEENDVPVNWDLMGGWASKSPLERTKLQRLGCAAGTAQDADAAEAENSTSLIMQEALVNLDNCCVAVKEGGSLEWLTGYYRFRGTEVRAVRVDQISDQADASAAGEQDGPGWDIYRIEAGRISGNDSTS